MKDKIIWTLVLTALFISIGGLTIYLTPESFVIKLQDGSIKAKYISGLLKVYNGRNLAWEDSVGIECTGFINKEEKNTQIYHTTKERTQFT